MLYERQVQLEKEKGKEGAECIPRRKGEPANDSSSLPSFMRGTGGGAKKVKRDDASQATTAVLPNDTIVYLMNNDLYFSPTNEHTPSSWVKTIAVDVLNRACEDAGRIRYLSKAIGNIKVYEWMEKVLEDYLERSVWLPREVAKK